MRSWIMPLWVTAYFLLFLIPRIHPAFNATPMAAVLYLSALVVVPAFIGISGWAIAASLLSRLKRQPIGLHSQRTAKDALAGSCGILILTLVMWLAPRPLPTGSNLNRFDRSEWLESNPIGGITPRQKMLSSVVRMLPGQSREQLEQMLGPSLDTEYFKSSGRDLIYFLGPERDSFFGIDSEWLLVWLNSNGMFERYEIATD